MEKLEYKKELFDKVCRYSEDSISGLVSVLDGKPFGWLEPLSKHGGRYWRVSINNQRYMAHRVIWCLLHGDICPILVIDHIDGNSSNNKKENLRLVTQKLNHRNRAKLSTNRTGVNGVSTHKVACGWSKNSNPHYNTYVRANWTNIEGKQKHKDFNVKAFPSFEHAVEFAALYREMKIEDGYTYSPSHGIRQPVRN